MPLQDLRDRIDEPSLELPIGGTTYVVPPVTAAVWVDLQALKESADAAAESGEPLDSSDPKLARWQGDAKALWRTVLGDTAYDGIFEACTPLELSVAGMTAFYWQLNDTAAANILWASAGKARGPRPLHPIPSSSTGSATTTPQPAFTTGTTPRRKSTKPRKPRTSPGGKSSPTAV
jgi:hypothetical protein